MSRRWAGGAESGQPDRLPISARRAISKRLSSNDSKSGYEKRVESSPNEKLHRPRWQFATL